MRTFMKNLEINTITQKKRLWRVIENQCDKIKPTSLGFY